MTDAEYEYLFRDADPRWKAYYRTRREEYRKKHTRTNFEKWRDSLTPEAFAKQATGYCGFTFSCLECPALKSAGGCPADVDIMNKICDEAKCSAFFLLWANAPAKEAQA